LLDLLDFVSIFIFPGILVYGFSSGIFSTPIYYSVLFWVFDLSERNWIS